jgi:branched-chain amino acid transport system ATP-binding protein
VTVSRGLGDGPRGILPVEHPDGSPSTAALELRGVTAAYGSIDVLRDVDLRVETGSIVALLGPNGGGKSTTLRVIAGQLVPRAGELLLAGRQVTGAAPQEIARRGVCLVPEGRGVFPNLTVRENLWMATHTGTSRARVEAVTFERFPLLGERRRQLAGSLSGGEQQMLALARALATDPALVLLDELSMGLAPRVVEQLYEIVAEVASSGVSILVVEQFARAVLGIAGQAGIMLNGRITASGDPTDIEAELSTAYLGG